MDLKQLSELGGEVNVTVRLEDTPAMAQGVDGSRVAAVRNAGSATRGRIVHAKTDHRVVGCRFLYVVAMGQERLSCSRGVRRAAPLSRGGCATDSKRRQLCPLKQ